MPGSSGSARHQDRALLVLLTVARLRDTQAASRIGLQRPDLCQSLPGDIYTLLVFIYIFIMNRD